MPILILDKVDFNLIIISLDKEAKFYLEKWVNSSKDITILNGDAPNNRVSKYIKMETSRTKRRNRPIHNYSCKY